MFFMLRSTHNRIKDRIEGHYKVKISELIKVKDEVIRLNNELTEKLEVLLEERKNISAMYDNLTETEKRIISAHSKGEYIYKVTHKKMQVAELINVPQKTKDHGEQAKAVFAKLHGIHIRENLKYMKAKRLTL